MYTKIDFEKLSTKCAFGVVVEIKGIQRRLDFRNEILMVVITVGTIFCLYDGQFYHKFISNIGTHQFTYCGNCSPNIYMFAQNFAYDAH